MSGRRLLALSAALVLLFLAVPATASALCFGSAATMMGTSGPDTITGTAGDDVIEAGDGNDTVNGGGGADKICGEAGDDTINGQANNDQLDGGANTTTGDTVTYLGTTSQLTANLLTGTATTTGGESDSLANFENLTGTNTFDILTGDSGPNVLTGLDAADGFRGGGGNDTLVDQSFPVDLGAAIYDDATGPVIGAVGAGMHTVTGQGVGTDTLIDVRAIEGSDFDDQLTGDGIGNELEGMGGNDLLEPLGGTDQVGGEGGTDTVTYANETGPVVTADLSSGMNGNVTAPGGNDTVFGVENLIGSAADDNITGGTENNVFDGMGGADHLNGGAGGSDTASFAGLSTAVDANLATGIATGQGTDTLTSIENLTGSLQNDTLTGDGNPNVLSGLNGGDNITGGPGADAFFLGAGADVITANDGVVDAIDCEGGGPDSGSVDGPAPAETYTLCDGDGDGIVDFLDACPTVLGSGVDGCVPQVVQPPAAGPSQVPAKKKKCKKRKHGAAAAKKCKKRK